MAAIEGFGSVAASTLTLAGDGGTIDGRNVPVLAGTVTASTTGGKFRSWILSEDGDGTYTVTMGTDDEHDSEALAFADIGDLVVPAGGIGLLGGVTDNTDAEYAFDLSVRGKLPPVSS